MARRHVVSRYIWKSDTTRSRRKTERWYSSRGTSRLPGFIDASHSLRSMPIASSEATFESCRSVTTDISAVECRFKMYCGICMHNS
eukprot:1392055-Amorphochlora_amoeboformis.AAC.1